MNTTIPTRRRRTPLGRLAATATLAAALAVSAAAESATATTEPSDEPAASSTPDSTADSMADSMARSTSDRSDVTITLVAYDSFPAEGTDINAALEQFTADTGIGVEILSAGDTGEMVTKAALTAGNPEGDVMFGIDSSFLSRAVDANVFEPHRAAFADDLRPEVTGLVSGDLVTPVDIGDVCINYDVAWFAENDLEPPTSLEDLTSEAYRGLLVVEDPTVSSPGLAFLLATLAQFGEGERGAMMFWRDLVDNDVTIVEDWTTAYYDEFTATGGTHPMVVSYATSPAAELVYADPPVDEAPTAVVTAGCFRLIEFAGVLAGTDHPDEARQLVDFLSGPDFQAALPLTNFVVPANATVELPAEFVETGALIEAPHMMTSARIAAGRDDWLEEWTRATGR